MNSKASSNKLLKAEALLSFKCTVSDYEQYDYCKGLVYLEDLVKDDIKEYEKDLIEEFPFIKKIEVACFIKSRNPKSTPVLMYFRTPVPPLSLIFLVNHILPKSITSSLDHCYVKIAICTVINLTNVRTKKYVETAVLLNTRKKRAPLDQYACIVRKIILLVRWFV